MTDNTSILPSGTGKDTFGEWLVANFTRLAYADALKEECSPQLLPSHPYANKTPMELCDHRL